MTTQSMTDLVLQHAPRSAMVERLASLCDRPDAPVYYFGCIERAGHYLWTRGTHGPRTDHDRERTLTLLFGGLDGVLCWSNAPARYSYERDETEGLALVTHRAGWTALAFWDRSVDKRGGCNSAFIAEGTLTFAQLVRRAKSRWPEVWARFSFEVVEVDASGRRL